VSVNVNVNVDARWTRGSLSCSRRAWTRDAARRCERETARGDVNARRGAAVCRAAPLRHAWRGWGPIRWGPTRWGPIRWVPVGSRQCAVWRLELLAACALSRALSLHRRGLGEDAGTAHAGRGGGRRRRQRLRVSVGHCALTPRGTAPCAMRMPARYTVGRCTLCVEQKRPHATNEI